MGDNFTLDEGVEETSQESTETGNQGAPTEGQETQGSEGSPDTEKDAGKPTEAQNQDKESQTQETETDGSGTEGKPINQEAVNRKIGKLVARRKEAETRAEEAERKLKEAEERLKEKESTANEIEIPPLPDAYDPEYESKLAERDAAIRKKAIATAAAEKAKEEQQEAEKKRQQESRQRFIDQTNAMYEAGEKIGIKKDELAKAEQTLSLFITDPALAQFILAHEDSALIVNHLANDVETLEKISQMPGVNASVLIATQVLPKAKQFKPSVSNAPDPLEIPSGKAARNEDPFLKGVTFE